MQQPLVVLCLELRKTPKTMSWRGLPKAIFPRNQNPPLEDWHVIATWLLHGWYVSDMLTRITGVGPPVWSLSVCYVSTECSLHCLPAHSSRALLRLQAKRRLNVHWPRVQSLVESARTDPHASSQARQRETASRMGWVQVVSIDSK